MGDVHSYDTIFDVGAKIMVEDDIHPEQQELIFAGKLLDDDRTLAHYKIQNESIIYMILRSATAALEEPKERFRARAEKAMKKAEEAREKAKEAREKAELREKAREEEALFSRVTTEVFDELEQDDKYNMISSWLRTH